MLHVVCAVVEHQGEILCMQKGDHKYPYISHHWEFPGGKVEAGESEEQALVRELMEEMDYHVKVERHLLTTDYVYPDFEISLSAYLCHPLNEETPRRFAMKEHLQALWLPSEKLHTLNWAPADQQLIEMLVGDFQ
ncbi:MAG: (deoxy)nucleoside triphosphate pyrophosphohydrolase [Bacteroidales bacterium]|nr:(deoxy)nucleoside triphosphate pyrophosphohydrolase [Bacteroidales bacterium]